jgi:flavin reductase (DIM6/NTAB) family NADH-FMN oxidoreductase RutF
MSTATAELSKVSSTEFKLALSQFASGVAIVTTIDAAGKQRGLTVSSFSSVSLEPPLVQWSLSTSCNAHAVFIAASHFAVSILAEDQAELSTHFSRAVGDRFLGVDFERGLHGLPLITGALAWLVCRSDKTCSGGDHSIFLGCVESCRVFDRKPLLHWRSRYSAISAL